MSLEGVDNLDFSWSIDSLIDATQKNLTTLFNEPLTKYYLAFLFVGYAVTQLILNKRLKIDFDESKELTYDIFSFFGLFFMGAAGTLIWCGFYGNLAGLDPRDPYASDDDVARYIVTPMICYQFWNFAVSLIVPGN